MVRALRAASLFLAWAAWTPAAWALCSDPSFALDDCGWNATHVVVVTEGDRIDGTVEVLESWRGNLRKGDVIHVPELAAFASRESRWIWNDDEVYNTGRKLAPGELTHVTCSRMVLFLKWNPEGTDPSKGAWAAAAPEGGLRVSLAWVERPRSEPPRACSTGAWPSPCRRPRPTAAPPDHHHHPKPGTCRRG
jgi:hypothetical protein